MIVSSLVNVKGSVGSGNDGLMGYVKIELYVLSIFEYLECIEDVLGENMWIVNHIEDIDIEVDTIREIYNDFKVMTYIEN